LFQASPEAQIRLLGAGTILNEVIRAADLLKAFEIEVEIWSVTSFNQLRKDGMESDRLKMLHPTDTEIESFVESKFSAAAMPVVAATDYVRAYAEQIRPWVQAPYFTLGTDGYGRSDSRAKLREFFEVDANAIVRTAAFALFKAGSIDANKLEHILSASNHQPEKPHPWTV